MTGEKAGAQMAEMGAIALNPGMMAELDLLHLPKLDAAAAAVLVEEIVLGPNRLEKAAAEEAEIWEAMAEMGRSLVQEAAEADIQLNPPLMEEMDMLGVLISECT